MGIRKIDIFQEFSSENPQRNVDLNAMEILAKNNVPQNIDVYDPAKFANWLKGQSEQGLNTPILNLGIQLTRGAVYDTLKAAPQIEGVNAIMVRAFIEASRIKFEELSETDSHQEKPGWQTQNQWLNYLRCIGLLPDVKYDEVHDKQIYDFTTNLVPTPFAQKINNSHNETLIRNKKILALGSGNGRDEKYFLEQGADYVEAVEGSNNMIEVIGKTRLCLPVQMQNRFIAPEKGEDIIEALKRLNEEGDTFDTIYSHAAFHFFDDTEMMTLFKLIKNSLTPNGNFVFATRKPGANKDGNGILLADIRSKSAKDRVRLRACFNDDGQVRYFRSHERLIEMIEQFGLIRDPNIYFTKEYFSSTRPIPWLYYFLFHNIAGSK